MIFASDSCARQIPVIEKAMPADSARPHSLVAPPQKPPQLARNNSYSTSQHLEPPKSPATAMNRLSLDSALQRKNPFARSNQLHIDTGSTTDEDVEPSLKSAPPVSDASGGGKRHSATFPLSTRGFLSPLLSPSLPEPSEPEIPELEPGNGCDVSEEEMQGILEHVRKVEMDRMRIESELARREKELARVKNELRRAESEVEDLKARLLAQHPAFVPEKRQENHVEQPQQQPQQPQQPQHEARTSSSSLKPSDALAIPPPASRHDSLDPNCRAGGHSYSSSTGSASASGSNNSPIAAPGESPYYYHAEQSSTSFASSQQSLRPYSCSAAMPPSHSRFPSGSSPRLTQRASMMSINEQDQLQEPPAYYHHVEGNGSGVGLGVGGAESDGEGIISPKKSRRKDGGGGGKVKERKSGRGLREKFSRMSFFGGKKDGESAPPTPKLEYAPAVVAAAE